MTKMFPEFKGQLREDFESYRWDHHLAPDTLRGFKRSEAINLLFSIYACAPNQVARALAIEHPLSADQYDHVERRIQELLPLE